MKIPPLPNNVNKKRSWRNIRGELRRYTILDEIMHVQSDYPRKVICLQQIRMEYDGRIQYRLGYYMMGVKPGMKGRWVWGQFSAMLPAKDFRAIIRKAERRGWF